VLNIVPDLALPHVLIRIAGVYPFLYTKHRHFTIRGADATDFAGGTYHGRILLPPDYPYKPPHIMFLTPSGRFETNTKICLSFSAYHPELWQPAWGIRLILEALISFLPTPADGAIGALDWSSAERKKLAVKSRSYSCPCCGPIVSLLPALADSSTKKASSRFQKEIEQLQLLQQQEHTKKEEEEEQQQQKQQQEENAVANNNAGETAAAIDDEDEGSKNDAAPSSSAPVEEEDVKKASETSHAMSRAPSDGDNIAAAAASPPSRSADNCTAEAAPTTTAAVSSPAAPAPAPAPAVAGPAAQAVAAPAPDVGNDATTWWYDPMLQVGIVLVSAIVYLLATKVEDAWGELQQLSRQLQDGGGGGGGGV
jgi:ubiquitin-conjugating enzyme E2 J1